MDFDFSSEEPKKGGIGFSDHSPNNAGGISPPGLGLSSSDDFEHISGDKLSDNDYDLLGSSLINAPSTNIGATSDKQNLLDGFSFTETTKESDFGFDSSPKFGSPAHQKTSTIDFMQAERNEPPPLPKQAPLKPSSSVTVSSSLLDEIEDDYLNPYAAKKQSAPILSAAQQQWDKDSDDEFGKRTPSPDPFVQTRTALEQQQNRAAVVPPVSEPSALAPVKPLEPEVIVKPTPVEAPKKPEKPIEVPKPKVEEVKPVKKPEPGPKASSSSTSSSSSSKVGLTAAEEIFCKIGLGELAFLLCITFCFI